MEDNTKRYMKGGLQHFWINIFLNMALDPSCGFIEQRRDRRYLEFI